MTIQTAIRHAKKGYEFKQRTAKRWMKIAGNVVYYQLLWMKPEHFFNPEEILTNNWEVRKPKKSKLGEE